MPKSKTTKKGTTFYLLPTESNLAASVADLQSASESDRCVQAAKIVDLQECLRAKETDVTGLKKHMLTCETDLAVCRSNCQQQASAIADLQSRLAASDSQVEELMYLSNMEEHEETIMVMDAKLLSAQVEIEAGRATIAELERRILRPNLRLCKSGWASPRRIVICD